MSQASTATSATINRQQTTTSPSRVRFGSQTTNEAAFTVEHQHMLAKMQRGLDELRSRYSAERKELLSAASDHVADARSEMDQTKQVASRCLQRVDAFRRQLRALESSAQAGAAASDVQLRAGLQNSSERLVQALDGLRESTEQTQLLQAAILNDRVRREARMRQARDEDAELELRMRHLEESNAVLRAELAAVKAVNAEAFKSIDKVLEICRPDATSAIHGGELKNIHISATRDLDDVRQQLTILAGKVESIDNFSKNEDARRNGLLEQLEHVVTDIEKKPPPPAFTPKIQAKILLDANAANNNNNTTAADPIQNQKTSNSGTYPMVPPRSNPNNNYTPVVAAAPPTQQQRPPAAASDKGLASFFGGNNNNSDEKNPQQQEEEAEDPVSARRRAAAQLRAANPHLQNSGNQNPQGSVFVPVPGSPASGNIPSLKNRLMAFYSKFNPSKINDVERILGEYRGAEAELMSSLEVHYNAFGYFDKDLTLPK